MQQQGELLPRFAADVPLWELCLVQFAIRVVRSDVAEICW
jgi:hypothetical protein